MTTKEAYQQKLEAQLDEWNAEIAKLKAKADKAEAEIRIAYNQQIEDLRTKEDAMRQKLNELKNSSESAWQDLKSGIDRAWSSLSDSIKSAQARF
jgi:uncharacterized coiled-coil DUF342 family protein